jgi:hypothetical protein
MSEPDHRRSVTPPMTTAPSSPTMVPQAYRPEMNNGLNRLGGS